MENLYIKDLVSFSGRKLICVQTSWSINQVVSYLIENDVPACPVIHSKIKNEVVGRIRGYAILKDLALRLKDFGENKIEDFMSESKWELSADQYLVDKISVLYEKPVFAITNEKNQYYATIFQKDVAEYLHHISSRFMYLRAIENKLSGFIFSIDKNESIYEVPFGVKIEKLFSDDIWNKSKIGFDKTRLHQILNKCSDIRNKFVHHRDSNVDVKTLKRSWKILKSELRYVPEEKTENQDSSIIIDFDDYLDDNPEIVKHLLKKNPKMTKEEAKIKAKKIWGNYCEQHRERDEKRELEHQRRWNEALKWESYNTLFEHADNYDLDD